MNQRVRRTKIIAAVSILTAAFFVWTGIYEQVLWIFTECSTATVFAAEQESSPGELYALSAVLMDGESGRVLYGKEAETARPNASTTKVLTCILALENAPGDDYVQVSANAAAQPQVKLGMQAGEQYYLEDLLYSLMLKSHNDTAVAIAEHIAGSVEEFAVMMNEKAKEIGCTDTHFVTPNGLDASDEGGEHRTTARDLALIMRYAIQNETFVRITQTRTYSFSDLSGKRQYTVQNANALLDMMDGVISGKTGFTGNAGYCYVCACQVDDRIFIVALLGCGWPYNKSYKWSDTRKLLAYGSENFAWQTLYQEPAWSPISVQEGVTEESVLGETVSLNGSLTIPEDAKTSRLLVGKDEKIRMKVNLPEVLTAPVQEGQEIGSVSFWLVDAQGRELELLSSYPILAEQSVERISYYWYVKTVFHSYFH